jgi:hypothetical protein
MNEYMKWHVYVLMADLDAVEETLLWTTGASAGAGRGSRGMRPALSCVVDIAAGTAAIATTAQDNRANKKNTQA